MEKYLKKHPVLFSITVILKVTSTVFWVCFAKVMEFMVDSTSDVSTFTANAIFVVFYIVFVRVLSFLGAFFGARFSNAIVYDLRQDYIKAVFSRRSIDDSGEIVSALDNDLQIIKDHYLENDITLITGVLSVALSSMLLLRISVPITIILYVLLALVFLIPAVAKKKLERIHAAYSISLKNYISYIKDFTLGFDVVKNNLLEG